MMFVVCDGCWVLCSACAGGDALCATLYVGGVGGDAICAALYAGGREG